MNTRIVLNVPRACCKKQKPAGKNAKKNRRFCGHLDITMGEIMKTCYMVRSNEFCTDCKETGGEYCVPTQYHCMNGDDKCHYPNVNCLFVQHGGKRPEGR